MTQIGKLSLARVDTESGQATAIQEIAAKLNSLIDSHSAVQEEVSSIQQTTGPQGAPGQAGPKGDAGPGYSRNDILIATGSLAPGAWERSSITMMLRGDLLIVSANKAARLILYSTAAAQAADIGRSLGTPVPLGQGILAEFSWSTPYSISVSPIARIANKDVPPLETIYYSIMNRSVTTGAITITQRVDKLPPTV